MSTAIKVRCQCGTTLKIKAKFAGQQAECPLCGNRFTASGQDPARESSFDPTESAAASAAGRAMETNRSSSRAEHVVNDPQELCQSCGKKIIKGALVCIYCGYHKGLQRKLQVSKSDSPGWGQSAGALAVKLMGYLGALASGGIVFLVCRGIEGPVFLQVFLGMFVLASVGVIVFRKTLNDSDFANHAALLFLMGLGGFRIADAVANGRFKFLFLVSAMIISAACFLITKTDGQLGNEKAQSKDGGLSIGAGLITYLIGGSLIAAIFFVGAIGQFIAEFGVLFVLMLLVILYYVWQAITGHSFGLHDGSGWSSCSSCSSCGGGGCGGGGCGGCGG